MPSALYVYGRAKRHKPSARPIGTVYRSGNAAYSIGQEYLIAVGPGSEMGDTLELRHTPIALSGKGDDWLKATKVYLKLARLPVPKRIKGLENLVKRGEAPKASALTIALGNDAQRYLAQRDKLRAKSLPYRVPREVRKAAVTSLRVHLSNCAKKHNAGGEKKQLEVMIRSDGTVAYARVRDASPALAACLEGATSGLSFPETRRGFKFHVGE